MPFIPHTAQNIAEMLAVIGVDSMDELFGEIPIALQNCDLSEIPASITEMDLLRSMAKRAKQDANELNFCGVGAYEHHIPAAI